MSHDGVLEANGHRGTQTDYRPLSLAPSHGAHRLVATCALTARPESAGVARDFTRMTLRQWRMPRLSDVAELVVSELVTNALRHGLLPARWMPGEHPIRLRLLRQDPYLMCMVSDPDTAGPVRIDAPSSAESGRGLQVVESCSVRWGWQPLDARALDGLDAYGCAGGAEGGMGRAGKVVWALLQAPESRRITGR